MKKVALMQPYFLPYLGYMQLIKSVDTFVIYDDISYRKGGWINRNNFLQNGKAVYFTLNLDKASSFKGINEIDILENNVHQPKKTIVATFQHAYAKAPYFDSVFPIIEDIVLYNELNLAKYIEYGLRKLSQTLAIDTKILVSSENFKYDLESSALEKVLQITKQAECNVYVNAIGGKALYNQSDFKKNNIDLKFIQMDKNIEYNQFDNKFVPNLSIVDVLMFNGIEKTKALLDKYTLID